MRILIVGVGAMGSLFAARLSPLAEITMLGHWPAQIESLNRQGITLLHPDGRKTSHPIKATSDPTGLKTADLILIMVKSPHTAVAAQISAAVLSHDGLVITLQNGLGNLETIVDVVGPERAALGTTSEGASIPEPGTVRHGGAGQTYLAKHISGQKTSSPTRLNKVTQAANLFNQVGFKTELVEQADSLVWGKLAVNAGINPLTALLQVPNGFLLQHEDAEWIMSQAAREAALVAGGLGIPLTFEDAAVQARNVAQATAANHSSMAQDVARGVPTEIEAICGPIVRHGVALGIPVPVNQALLELVRRQSSGGRWQEALEGQPANIRQKIVNLIRTHKA